MSMRSGKMVRFFVAIAILIIDYEVIASYIFNAPTNWSTEAITIICGIFFGLIFSRCD